MMKIDDPGLTAFALDELAEPEKSKFARAVAQSPEAQRYVDATRELARALKNEFSAEMQTEATPSPNIILIRDDPWFWSIARPLAIAAAVAICGIVVALVFSKQEQKRHFSVARIPQNAFTVEAVESATPDALLEISGPKTIPNPLPAESIGRVNRVVVAESGFESSEKARVIEVITDNYRVQRLRDCLTTPVFSKKPEQRIVGRSYYLLFLDGQNGVVASANFYRMPGVGFVLQLSPHAPQFLAHEFAFRAGDILPGRWESRVNYSDYAIPFPNWPESVGYCPGA